jgi:hypothetical protein
MIVDAYTSAASALSRRVQILPNDKIENQPDLAVILAIAKYKLLLHKCAEAAAALQQREQTLSSHLEQHPLPTAEIIRTKDIRGGWHDYKDEIRARCVTLDIDTQTSLHRLRKTEVGAKDALRSYWDNPAQFRALVNQYNIFIKA